MENKALNKAIEKIVESQQQLLGLYCVGTPEYEKQKIDLLKSLGYVTLGGKKIIRTYRKKKNVCRRRTKKSKK